MTSHPHRLGRRHEPDPLDHAHLMSVHLPLPNLPITKHWDIAPKHLDQGQTGTCVGHAWRNFLACSPVRTIAKHPNAYDIYRAAVLADTWPENDDESKLPDGDAGLDSGTSVRAGAKAVAAMGELTSYLWSFRLQPTIEWILTRGPVVVGCNWYDSMFDTDETGHVEIAIGSGIVGGHSFLVRGASQKKALVTCVNSWGNGWGKNGDFTLSFQDLERLILEDGEVCAAVQKGT